MEKNSSLFDMIAGTAQEQAQVNVSDDKLKRVSELAMKQQQMEDWILKNKETLSKVEADLRKLRELELPEAMDEVGIAKFTLLDGSEVSVKPFYGASIPPERKGEAFSWLEENGFGDIIKNEVIVRFGKGEQGAQDLLSTLRGLGFDPDNKESVHAQTLKAFIREQVEAGHPVPLDIFGAYIGRQTTIKKG